MLLRDTRVQCCFVYCSSTRCKKPAVFLFGVSKQAAFLSNVSIYLGGGFFFPPSLTDLFTLKPPLSISWHFSL